MRAHRLERKSGFGGGSPAWRAPLRGAPQSENAGDDNWPSAYDLPPPPPTPGYLMETSASTRKRCCGSCSPPQRGDGAALRRLQRQLQSCWSAIDAVALDRAQEIERANTLERRVRALESGLRGGGKAGSTGGDLLDALAERVAVRLAAALPDERSPPPTPPKAAAACQPDVDAAAASHARVMREVQVLRGRHTAAEAAVRELRSAHDRQVRRLDGVDESLAAVCVTSSCAAEQREQRDRTQLTASAHELEALRTDVAHLRLELDAATRGATDEARVATARASSLETALRTQSEFWQREYLEGSRRWQGWRAEMTAALNSLGERRGGEMGVGVGVP